MCAGEGVGDEACDLGGGLAGVRVEAGAAAGADIGNVGGAERGKVHMMMRWSAIFNKRCLSEMMYHTSFMVSKNCCHGLHSAGIVSMPLKFFGWDC